MRKWKSVLDDQTCDACAFAHGMVIWPGERRPPLHARFELDPPYAGACRCVLEPARVLAVGERFNYHKWWRPLPQHEDSLDLRLKMGFYNRKTPGSRRIFLNSLGVVWTDGINLLWPSPIPGYWNKQEAEKAVYYLRPRIEEKYDVVLLFGRRVCEAFDVEYRPLVIQDYLFVPMPHPSGRCRTWNDCEFLGQVRRFFK